MTIGWSVCVISKLGDFLEKKTQKKHEWKNKGESLNYEGFTAIM